MTMHASITAAAALDRAEVQHYSRHLLIPEVGLAGQQRLKNARVLLVGAGGLGSPAAQYLTAAGIGTIGIVEHDIVETSNLQRQILYTTNDVGQRKLDAAAARLAAMNPHISIQQHHGRLDAENAQAIIADYDLVIDGTDNFATRYLVNDACVLLGKPNVYASVFRFEGLLSVFGLEGGPCYRCLYPEPPPPELAPSCAEGGVFGVLPGIMGTLQAAEAIKLIVGLGTPMRGRLLRMDAATMSFSEFAVERDPDCAVCGEHPTVRDLAELAQLCAGTAGAPQAPVVVPTVTPAAFEAERTRGAPMQIIDVRARTEYEIVHVPGAELIPVDDLDLHLGRLRPDLRTLVYCKSGVRSARAVQMLQAHGFTDAASLSGGVIAWAQAHATDAPLY
jgi:adenylyltransferase/sulfurtransferase